jgi:hypothetical protein
MGTAQRQCRERAALSRLEFLHSGLPALQPAQPRRRPPGSASHPGWCVRIGSLTTCLSTVTRTKRPDFMAASRTASAVALPRLLARISRCPSSRTTATRYLIGFMVGNCESDERCRQRTHLSRQDEWSQTTVHRTSGVSRCGPDQRDRQSVRSETAAPCPRRPLTPDPSPAGGDPRDSRVERVRFAWERGVVRYS